MAFDRAGARAAGYSDQEINAYLAQQGPASYPAAHGIAPGHAPYSGAPDRGLRDAHPIEGAMALSGVPGLVRAVPGAVSAGGQMMSELLSQPVGRAIAKIIARRALGPVGDALEIAGAFGKGQAGKVATELAPAAESVAARAMPVPGETPGAGLPASEEGVFVRPHVRARPAPEPPKVVRMPRPARPSAPAEPTATPAPRAAAPKPPAANLRASKPAAIGGQLQRSLKIQAEMDRRNIPADLQAEVWKELRAQGF